MNERTLNDGDFRELVKVTALPPQNVGEILAKMDNRIIETIVMICTEALKTEWTNPPPLRPPSRDFTICLHQKLTASGEYEELIR